MLFSSVVFLDSKIIKNNTQRVARFVQNNFAKVLAVLVFGGMVNVGWGQTNNYFGTSGTITSSVWSASVGGPYTSAFNTTSGGIMNFNNTVTSFTGGTIIVAGINATASTATMTASGTISNLSNGVITINVGTSTATTLDFGTQSFTTSATAGYIKSGVGALAMSGNTYGGGFTLSAGTIVARSTNAMGGNATPGLLTLNGGTLAANATRDFTGKYSNIVIGGNIQFGEVTGNVPSAAGASNLTFSNNMTLGAATRTLTLGGSGNITFGGIISNTPTNGLTLAGNANGTGKFKITGTANTFTGTLTLSGPETEISGANSVGNVNNTIVIDGGRLTPVASFTLASTHNIQVSASSGTSISCSGSGTILTYDGVISDKPTTTGAWAKQGGGTLSLGGVSTYTGATAINNGTLKLTTGSNRLPTGTILSLGQTASGNLGTFDLNGQNQTIAGLNTVAGTATSLNNTITSIAAATLTINSSTNNSFGSSLAANPGIISGAISIVKSGAGTQTFGGGANYTYTGTTTLTGGKIELDNTNVLPATQLILNGGTLSTGATAGFSETVGTLNLNANSTIALGTGVHTLTFANSSAVTWAGTTLTITGWTGSAGSSGTAGKIVVGASGLDASQLAKINFSGYSNGAQIVAGEVVPAAAVTSITPSGNITGLTYVQGSGPSTGSSITLTAANLTSGGGDITITASTNFEVSTTSSTTGFGASATMPYTGTGTIASNTLWVRLKAGLSAATYSVETIDISGGGTTASFTAAGSVTSPPTLTPSVASITGLNYTGTGPSSSQSFTFSGANLTGFPANITVTAPTNFEVSADNVSFFSSITYAYSSGTLGAQTAYARLISSLPATSYGPSNVTIEGGGATSATVALSGTVTATAVASITPSGNLTGLTYVQGSGPSTGSSITLTAGNLTSGGGDITITASTNFEVSTTSSTIGFGASATMPYTGTGTIASNILWVRLKAGLSAATYSPETINISGGGTTTSFTADGAVTSPPALTPSVASITGLNYTGTGPSSSQSFTFSGANLTGFPANITVTAPTNFEISTDNVSFFSSRTYAYSSGTLGAQTVYVRLIASLPATTYGPSNVTIEGGGATSATIALSGTVTPVALITSSSVNLSGYSYIVGAGPSTSQSFTFTGDNLTGFPSNITITGSTNYEVSTNNSSFSASITYPYTSSTLTAQTVYVRLKTGLSAATYTENITISGGGVSPSITVSNSGSVLVAPFTLGNLAAVVAAASASNTTASVIEIGTSAFQASPISTTVVNGTDAVNGMRFSGSATSTLYLANSNDGTLITFTGHNSTNTASNANTLLTRAVITYNNSKTFNKATTYTGASGNQTRCASTLNNTSWYIGDQSGFYTNGSSSPSPALNIRGVKAYGATMYAQGSTIAIGTISAANGGTFTLLNGLTASTNNLQDFAFVSSGSNGAAFDVLYCLYTTKIEKYSLVSGTWTANGSYTFAGGGFGLTAKNIGIGSELYVSTGNGANTANSIVKLTDNVGFNTTINITTASNLTLYTAAAGTIIKGVACAPISATAPNISINASPLNGFTYILGSGPSAEQTFTVSGTNLSANSIALNVDSDFEICLTSGGTFVNTLSLTPAAGTVASTTIYVRLKSGLSAGNYSNRLITLSTANAYNRYIILDGSLLPNVNLSVSAASGTEVGTTSITVTVTSTSTLAFDETVDVTVAGTSLTAGDYSLVDGDGVLSGVQIKILAGASTGTSTFTLVDDNLNEGTEVASINISNPSAGLYLGGTSSQNVSITDNDDAVILSTIDVASTATNFNELVTSGTSTEVSKGAYYLETGSNQNLVYSAGDGSLSTGDSYAFGSGISTDRALGSSITSGLSDVKVGFKVKNSIGASFNAMIVEYYGEQWRRGLTGNAANGGAPARDKLKFEYSTSAPSLAAGTWGSSSILNFHSPDYGTVSTNTARDGNAAAYRQLVRDTIFIPSGVADGSSVWVRWVHNTAGTSGSRDGLGVDDVTFTPINFTPTVFYTDTIGSLDQLSTWWTNTDGTGANPLNFSSTNQTFIVQNRSTASIAANWSVSGSNSSIRIRNGVIVTIPDTYSFVGTVDSLEGTSTLILNNATTPILNNIDATSTVIYGSSSNQDIAIPTSSNSQYGNLTLTGDGIKRVTGGFHIEGEYLFNSASVDADSTYSTVFFKKNITISGAILYSTNYITYVNLQAYGSSAQQLIGNGRTIKAGSLLMNVSVVNGTLITSGSDLKTGSLTLASNTNLTLVDDLKLNANAGAATFTDNANTIAIGGDLECAGNTANYSFSGTLLLNGATASDQTISNTAGATFNIMTINKASGIVLLSNNLTINSALNLTNGIIDLQASNLNMASNTVNGGSATSYVRTSGVGVLNRNVSSSAVVFPVGNSAYNPATLSNSGTSDEFSLRVYDYVSSTGVEGGVPTSGQAVNRTWMVSEALTGGSNVTLKMQWNAGEEVNGFVYSPGFMNVNHHNGSVWEELGVLNESNSPFYVEQTGITSFSPFTIGITGSPLPIELISFQANCQGTDQVAVTWSTASEHNTSHFVVEKSRDGLNWVNLKSLGAAGNSTTIIEYAVTDTDVSNGISYYRLTQLDTDGASETFNIASVNCGAQAITSKLVTYPNPSNGSFYLDFYSYDLTGPSSISVFDSRGLIIYSQEVLVEKGSNVFHIEKMEAAPGMYYIQVSNGTTTSYIVKHSLR